MNSSGSQDRSYYLTIHLWPYHLGAYRKMNGPSWLRKWGSVIFSGPALWTQESYVFLNNVKTVLFPDSCLFCTPPFKKNSIIFNQQHRQTSTEMAVLFSMHGNVFLKSEVTRSTGQRNPRWHSYLISFLARSYSADGLEGWPLWHFCITDCYSNCLCKCFFIRLLLVPQRLIPGCCPCYASLGQSSVWLTIAVS